MKQQISPPVAIAIVVVIVAIAAFALTRGAGVENKVGDKPPGMPPDVAAKWNQYTGGNGPGAGGASIPTGPGGGATAAPGGVPTGPPMGR